MFESGGCQSDSELERYLNGDVTSSARDKIARHISRCEQCAHRLNEITEKRASAISGAVTIADPSAEDSEYDSEHSPSAETQSPQNPGDENDPVFRLSASYVRLVQLVGNTNANASGEAIGHYSLRKIIGRGGMGVVIRAVDTRLARDVAIKVLAPELCASAKSRRRFQREARAAAGINHPNVVTIFEINEVEGLPFLAMEFLKGGDLRDRLRHTPALSLVQILQISLQIADALKAAHRMGVIHRDVKPANILLEEGVDRVKLTDFGLAIATQDVSMLTSQGETVGTPQYLAPEIIRGSDATVQSDLFSFGCVIYAMVTGHSPFRGSNPIEVIHKIANLNPQPLHSIDPSIPEAVSDIVVKLLKKDIRHRYQSADAVLQDLQQQLVIINTMSSDTFQRLRMPRALRQSLYRRMQKPVAIGAAFLIPLVLFIGWSLWGSSNQPHAQHETPPKSTNRETEAVVETMQPDRKILSVAADGTAQFTTIQEALAAAEPNATIQIRDDSEYLERIEISDSSKHSGLIIESLGRATFRSPAEFGHVVSIKNTPRVKLRRLKLEAGFAQHCVIIEGNCPGLLLDDLICNQPADCPRGNIVFWYGARGESTDPVEFHNLQIHFGLLGVIVIGANDQPSRAIKIQNCHFFSNPPRVKDLLGAAITFERAVEQIEVSGSSFYSGPDGIRFRQMEPKTGKDIRIFNNSFLLMRRWITFEEAAVQQVGIRFERNLVLQTPIDIPDAAVINDIEQWFDNNWWETNSQETSLKKLAKPVPKIDLISRDPKDHNFLVPVANMLPDRAGNDRPAALHIGAYTPAPDEDLK